MALAPNMLWDTVRNEHIEFGFKAFSWSDGNRIAMQCVDSARQRQNGERKRRQSERSGSQRDREKSEMRVGVYNVHTLCLYPSI